MKTLNDLIPNAPIRIRRGVTGISLHILQLVIKRKGKVLLLDIEKNTKLNCISTGTTAGFIKLLMKEKLLKISNGYVLGNVKELMIFTAKEKTNLPGNHNKLWSDEEIELMCELKLQEVANSVIAIKIKRTERSVRKKCNAIQNAFDLIPLMKRSKAVHDFASMKISPKTTSNI